MTAPPAIDSQTLRRMKQAGDKITVLTAYDASLAAKLEDAGVDVILVGDSLGMVVQGHDSTLPVSMDDMIYHTRCVARGRRQALLVTDMPYRSYTSAAQALDNARRLVEAGADMVKLEGAGEIIDSIRVLTREGIAVCGHLGLLPQSIEELGGYRVQGREEAAAQQMITDALALQEAGAAMIVLECIPAALAARLSEAIDIPTIGIGAGVDCDGQVLVTYDLLGLTAGKRPRFSKDFLVEQPAGKGLVDALRAFVDDVRARRFPTAEHSFD